MKKISFIFLLSIIFIVNAFSQTARNNSINLIEEKENQEKSFNKKFDYNITLTQGFSYKSKQINFHYVNLDVGFKIFNKHEFGVCLGDNDMIWYGGYYRIYFEENINIGLKIAKDDTHTDYLVLNEISIGKDLKITDNFYFRLQVFASTRAKYPLGIKNENHSNKGGILIGLSYLL